MTCISLFPFLGCSCPWLFRVAMFASAGKGKSSVKLTVEGSYLRTSSAAEP